MIVPAHLDLEAKAVIAEVAKSDPMATLTNLSWCVASGEIGGPDVSDLCRANGWPIPEWAA